MKYASACPKAAFLLRDGGFPSPHALRLPRKRYRGLSQGDAAIVGRNLPIQQDRKIRLQSRKREFQQRLILEYPAGHCNPGQPGAPPQLLEHSVDAIGHRHMEVKSQPGFFRRGCRMIFRQYPQRGQHIYLYRTIFFNDFIGQHPPGPHSLLRAELKLHRCLPLIVIDLTKPQQRGRGVEQPALEESGALSPAFTA